MNLMDLNMIDPPINDNFITNDNNKSRITCRFCSRQFHKPCKLEEHERTHTGEKPFVCEACGNAYRRKDHLLRHLATAHVEPEARPSHPCPECGQTFSWRSHMRRHVRLMHGEAEEGDRGQSGGLKCPLCTATFHKKSQRRAHITAMHPAVEHPHPCTHCLPAGSVSFATPGKLRNHLYKCHADMCPDVVSAVDEERRAKRRRIEDAESSYLCGYAECQEGGACAFRSRRELAEHHREMHGIELVVEASGDGDGGDEDDDESTKDRDNEAVELVDSTVTSETTPEATLPTTLATTPRPPRSLACKICHQAFRSHKALQYHFRVQHRMSAEERAALWRCEDCGKSLSSKKSLQVHREMVHMGLRPFKCERCESAFASKDSMRRHMKLVPDCEKPVHDRAVKAKSVPAITPPPTPPSLLEQLIGRIDASDQTVTAGEQQNQERSSTSRPARNIKHFRCPVPGCQHTFKRKYDLVRHVQSVKYHGDGLDGVVETNADVNVSADPLHDASTDEQTSIGDDVNTDAFGFVVDQVDVASLPLMQSSTNCMPEGGDLFHDDPIYDDAEHELRFAPTQSGQDTRA